MGEEGKRFVFWFIVVIMSVAALAIYSDMAEKKNAPARAQAQIEKQQRQAQQDKNRKKIEAYVISQDYVASRLKSPASAKFPHSGDVVVMENSDGTFEIAAYVDSQNSFGAMMRTRYLCKLQQIGNNNWTLISLDFIE